MAYIGNRSNVSLPWRPRWRIIPEGVNAVRMGYANVDTPAFSWKVGQVVPWRVDPLAEAAGSRGLRGLTFDGTGLFGTGLFSSGLDMSQWTIYEWAIVLGGGYLVWNTIFSGPAKQRREKLQKARLDYRKAVADIRDEYPRISSPRKAFGL